MTNANECWHKQRGLGQCPAHAALRMEVIVLQSDLAEARERIASLERRVLSLEAELLGKDRTIDRLIREADAARPGGPTL